MYAFRFMTVIPIPWKEGEDLDRVARSISLIPLVGLVIGLTISGIFTLSTNIFSNLFTSGLMTIWWIFITGGLHLDGLSDSSDGLFGGTTVEKRLEIMKDSRTGVFGVLTLICFILLKLLTINELIINSRVSIIPILISIPIISRWCVVFSIFSFKSAKEGGLGVFFKKFIRVKDLILSLILTVGIIFYFTGLLGVLVTLLSTLITFLLSLFYIKKLGGLTGDLYGAINEIIELISMLQFLILSALGILNW
nr:adenosylcobinamide-GDP ribazoletransferase [Thiospirochaeta perfilievii]